MNSEKYIGLDVHQATISVAVLDSTGKCPWCAGLPAPTPEVRHTAPCVFLDRAERDRDHGMVMETAEHQLLWPALAALVSCLWTGGMEDSAANCCGFSGMT